MPAIAPAPTSPSASVAHGQDPATFDALLGEQKAGPALVSGLVDPTDDPIEETEEEAGEAEVGHGKGVEEEVDGDEQSQGDAHGDEEEEAADVNDDDDSDGDEEEEEAEQEEEEDDEENTAEEEDEKGQEEGDDDVHGEHLVGDLLDEEEELENALVDVDDGSLRFDLFLFTTHF